MLCCNFFAYVPYVEYSATVLPLEVYSVIKVKTTDELGKFCSTGKIAKFEFPYDVKIGTYFIEYEKAWGTVYLERDDFDISKLEVKEYFHKQNDDNAVLVSYDGVDLLKNIEIEAGTGSRFFTTTID